MATVWTIAVDWNRDGTFTGPYDDLSNLVISANWFVGSRQPYGEVADDSQLELVLRNDDRRFSPEYTGSPLYGLLNPFKPIRIQANDGATLRTLWVGWIESVEPDVNISGARQAKIKAAGPMMFLKAVETNIPLQAEVRANEVLIPLVYEVVIPPAVQDMWVVGRSQLGDDTKLGKYSDFMDFQQGATVFTLVADNWVRQGGFSNEERDTFDVYRAIQDMVAAERGRFFFNRAGKAIFWNRHHLLYERTPAATFDDTMQDLEYSYAGLSEFKNEVVVACHPRSISATSDEILWQLENEVRIPPNSTRQIRAKYTDDAGNRIAGRNITFTSTFSQGNASISLSEAANNVTLKVENTGVVEAVLSGCVIRGQKITDAGRMEAITSDKDSIRQYGRRTMKINLPVLSDYDDARGVARFELMRRKTPRGAVQSMTLISHGKNGGGHHAHQLALTIGDLITVHESQAGHGENYYIIGEAHRLSKSGTLFETTWFLERQTTGFWVLGQSKLGVDTLPGY